MHKSKEMCSIKASNPIFNSWQVDSIWIIKHLETEKLKDRIVSSLIKRFFRILMNIKYFDANYALVA